MSDVSIVSLKKKPGPCVFCGYETDSGIVGWHQAHPVGPVCDACLLDQEKELGVFLKKARARGNGRSN